MWMTPVFGKLKGKRSSGVNLVINIQREQMKESKAEATTI